MLQFVTVKSLFMKSKLPLAQKKQSSKSQIKMASNHIAKDVEKKPLANKKINKQNQSSLVKKVEKVVKPTQISKGNPDKSKQYLDQALINQKGNPKPLQNNNKNIQQLLPCKECGRKFVQTSLKRHQKVCKKIFINKRKEFNSAKQRIVSKEQVKITKESKEIKPSKNKMPIWKQQSMAFRLALKQARGCASTAQQLDFLAKEKKIVKASMFKCKGCGRNFNEESGKRHEVHCLIRNKDVGNKGKRK